MKKTAREVAGLQRRQLGGSGHLGQFEADPGVRGVKHAQDPREHRRHRQPREPHAHRADLALRERPQVARQRGEATEQRLASLQQHLAGRSQFDPAARAVEEPRAKVFLQLGDCPAQRRLGDRQRLRGATKMQPSRHLAEVGELAQGFNAFVSKLRHTLGSIATLGADVANASNQ